MFKRKIRFVSLLLAVVLLLGALPFSASAADGIGTAKVTAYGLNLRSGPGTGYAVKGLLYLNASVTVLSKAANNWYEIRTAQGATGYCSGEYLNVTLHTDAPAPSGLGTAKVTAYGLNLRSGPGTNYTVKAMLYLNNSVTVLAKAANNWYQVRTAQGVTGYCSGEYLQITWNTASPSAVPTAAPTSAPDATGKPAPDPTVKPTAAPTPSPGVIGTAKVTAYGLNVRSGPGTGYAVKGMLYLNNSVTVLSKYPNNWYEVRSASGLTGWCSGEYLQVTLTAAPTPTPAPTASPTPVPTATPTPAPTATAAPTETPTAAPSATPAASPSASPSAVPSPSGTPVVTATPAPTPVTVWTAKVTASALYVRSGPGTNYSSKGFVYRNETLTVLEEAAGGWYKIRTGSGTEGYCSGEWLTVSKTSVIPTPAPTPMPTVTGSVTEEQAYARLRELEQLLPDKKFWNHYGINVPFDAATNNQDFVVTNTPCQHSLGRIYCNYHHGIAAAPLGKIDSKQCMGFVSMLSDQVFGQTAPVTAHLNWDKLRVGDEIRLGSSEHSLMVVTKDQNSITVAECNATYSNCIIWWNRRFSRSEIESDSNRLYITRYPEPGSDGSSQVMYTNGSVKLRKEASDNAAVVTTLSSGSTVCVIHRRTEGWYYVQSKTGIQGYVRASSLRNFMKMA